MTTEPENGHAEHVMYRALEKGLSFKVTLCNILTLTAGAMDKPLIHATDNQAEQIMGHALDILDACFNEIE